MGKPRDLWLVVDRWVGFSSASRVAIGPWPSKARRAIAATAWLRDGRTVAVRMVFGRPRGAGEYLTPRLTKAERNALERRREEKPRG